MITLQGNKAKKRNRSRTFHDYRAAKRSLEVLLSLLPRHRKHVQVQAVDDDGLRSLLERLEVLDSIGRDARCSNCGSMVTLETISAVYPENGEVRFICSNGKCAAAVAQTDG